MGAVTRAKVARVAWWTSMHAGEGSVTGGIAQTIPLGVQRKGDRTEECMRIGKQGEGGEERYKELPRLPEGLRESSRVLQLGIGFWGRRCEG